MTLDGVFVPKIDVRGCFGVLVDLAASYDQAQTVSRFKSCARDPESDVELYY